jgi:hypothetical protein
MLCLAMAALSGNAADNSATTDLSANKDTRRAEIVTFPLGINSTSRAVAMDVRNGREVKIGLVNASVTPFGITFTGRPFYGGDFGGNGVWYVVATPDSLYSVDTTSGALSYLGQITGIPVPVGSNTSGLTWDYSSNTMYMCNLSGGIANLYTLNLATRVATPIGPILTGTIIDIACSNTGQIYGIKFAAAAGVSDSLVSINKTTGAGTTVGPLGVDVNFAHGMDFDPVTDSLFYPGYIGGGVNNLYRINTTTGLATLVGPLAAGEYDCFSVMGSPGGAPVVNRALLLPTPGVNTNYVQIPFQASMVGFGNNITIEAWVRTGGSTTANTILNKGAASFDYQLGINATTMNPFFRAGSTVVIATTVTVTPGVWTHLAATYDGTTVRVYKDGVMAFSQASALTLGSSTNEMRVGRGNADAGSGNIEEVRLWSVARTQGQIDSTKCLKYPGQFLSTAGLKAVWHFDSTYVDSISNYNGTPLGNVGFEIATLPCGPVGVAENHPDIPDDYQLAQNYPNPFNPTTIIQYGLPVAADVTLRIYNVLGQEVITLYSGQRGAGTFQTVWNGRNSAGNQVASGMYFYSLVAKSADNASTFTNIKKMLFLK